MFVKNNTAMSALLVLVGILSSITAAQSTGVCYGTVADNLPSKPEVIALYKSNGFNKMRIFNTDVETLQALKGSGIELIMGIDAQTIQSIATDPNAATTWVSTYVTPYQDVNFKFIAVGNEIHPSDNVAQYVLLAITNLQKALSSTQIKVSTVIDGTLVTNTYPPKNGVFISDALPYITPIINFLVSNGGSLLANVYPYFAYASDPTHISLDYALFTQQGKNEVGYQNLFDAMLDGTYYALEKVGAPNLEIVVTESGWPSEGGTGTTMENAGKYYHNLVNHANSGNGSPKKPGVVIDTYLFAMFDEDQKPGPDSERHFGLFRPDKSPKY